MVKMGTDAGFVLDKRLEVLLFKWGFPKDFFQLLHPRLEGCYIVKGKVYDVIVETTRSVSHEF